MDHYLRIAFGSLIVLCFSRLRALEILTVEGSLFFSFSFSRAIKVSVDFLSPCFDAQIIRQI